MTLGAQIRVVVGDMCLYEILNVLLLCSCESLLPIDSPAGGRPVIVIAVIAVIMIIIIVIIVIIAAIVVVTAAIVVTCVTTALSGSASRLRFSVCINWPSHYYSVYTYPSIC